MVNNEFFKHYFPDINFVYQLPFVFGRRFKNKTNFFDRLNRCFATGTLTSPPKSCTDFFDFFGTNTFVHPMRKKIYDNVASLDGLIDSSITYADDLDDVRKIKSDDSFKIKLIKNFLPYFLIYKLLPNYKNKYFKFDIVEKYNSYRMFICPEEAAGVMPIGALEGMACGCALIAADDPMYTKLGMIDGVHYIAYEKYNLDDLKDKIKFYQLPENQNKLKDIAKNGHKLVSENLNENRIADVLWSDLEILIKNFNNDLKEFRCSFHK
jgi:glycosyltransferase involved in cell wall biosynthesis